MSRRSFLSEQIAALQPLDFVAFVAEGHDGIAFVEVQQLESGERFRLEAGAEPAVEGPARAALRARGWTPAADGLTVEVDGADAAAALTDEALADAFGCPDGAPLDVRHGSHRQEAETARRLAALRDRVAGVLTERFAEAGVAVDADGDYVVRHEGTRLIVAPRVVDDGPPLVRVMSALNTDVDPVPALGLFVAQTDFELELGRLAYDGADRTVWFELSLVGEAVAADDLHFALRFVALGADELGARIADLFGGRRLAGEEVQDAVIEPGAGGPGTAGYL